MSARACRHAAVLAWLSVVGCSPDDNLARAIGAGAERVVTAAPDLETISWTDLGEASAGNDSLLRQPHALCWTQGVLVVADRRSHRAVTFDGDYRPLRTIPARGDRSLVEISGVSCGTGAAGGPTILLADQGAQQVVFADTAGTLLSRAPAPMTPQRLPLLGDVALATDGSWYVSWLATRSPIGPYLADEEWESVPLAEHRASDGELLRSVGTPVAYTNTVARRVLNRVFMAHHRDTLWVLTQGDAVLQGFTPRGEPLSDRILLPIYFRGKEPSIEVRKPLGAGMSFRYNEYRYHPNVGGIAPIGDSLFAVVRFRDWGMRKIGAGLGTFLPWANSGVEVYDRRGVRRAAIDAPGMIVSISSDGGSRLGIVSRLPSDGSYHAYVARLPGAAQHSGGQGAKPAGLVVPNEAATRSALSGACAFDPAGDAAPCPVPNAAPPTRLVGRTKR